MTSAQHLVRALKAPSDPPVAEGPPKITIAEQAWRDESFYLPKKAEVIGEFILSKFFKERVDGTSLGSERYWKLLSEVLSSNSTAWLRPILARISIVPIVTASMNSWSQLESLHHAANCISILYPLGSQKSNAEVLLDVWGVFLNNFVDDVSAVKVGLVLTKVYSDTLSNSASRKRASTNFVNNADFFNAWLERLTSSSSCLQYDHLRQSILSSGVETIFNLDTLRPISESPESTPLFLALSSAPRPTVLKALPLLFEHYVSSLKKHRGILSSELNVVAMRFYDACTNLVLERDTEAWNTISTLTELVEKESLYEQGSSLGQNIAFALAGELTTAVVRCLSATIRVDYDLVLPFMGQLLSKLLATPQVHPDHIAFLDLLLDYHMKTRTMNAYIEAIISCLSPDPTVFLPAQDRYATTHSSPVLHPWHLEKLGKAVRQFLTPSQCNDTVGLVCETIKLIRQRHSTAEKRRDADSGKGSRKKRKSDETTVDTVSVDALALAFSLISKVGQTVLGSLPISSIPQHQAEQMRATVAEFGEFVEHNLSRLLKSFVKSEDEERSEVKRKVPSEGLPWGTQVVIISLLRLRYSLGLAKALSLPPIGKSKLLKRLLSAACEDEECLLPELALEIFRALFDQALVIDKSEASQFIDNAFQFVDRRIPTVGAVAWSGFPHELTFGEPGRTQAGLAALHLLLERWLPAINIVATDEQQQTLARLILHISSSSGPLPDRGTDVLVAGHLLFRTLHSAQFWELRNVRTAVLSALVASTSSLDSLPAESSSSEKPHVEHFKVAEVVSAYKLLLFFPVEYITKSCRADFVKKAVIADWRLSKGLGEGNEYEELLMGLSVVRTFLKRTFGFFGMVEQQTLRDVADFILHLLKEVWSIKGQPDYVQTTLDLCQVYFLELLRHATRGGCAEVREVLNSYLQSSVFDNLESVKARSLVCLVELLRREFMFASFSPDVQLAFQDVHARLTKDLKERLDGVLETSVLVSPVDVPELLTLWHALLGLGQWMALESCTFFGARLLKKFNVRFLLTQNNRAWADQTGVIIMATLLRELHYFRDEMERGPLNIVVAGYFSYRTLVSSPRRVELDDFFARACRQFSPANFEYVLGLLDEALVATPSMATHLVHLALVLLGNHPHSTLRIMQGFFTRSLDIFTNCSAFTTGPLDIRLQTLDFLVEHASDRPAALRPLDLGSIWSLLSKFLSPSAVHDDATSAPIFHKIVTVLSAIIRLRRDLATPVLPHLGMILRQLILCMRKCRPQLASKQTEMVMGTQPQWITAGQSLGVEEAKALSRVLEMLTTKTITRVHATPAETQKAESLAAPFSKHAVFVLKAYIEAMNDPLCVLTLDVRKELLPGLYALCGIIGEHSRDAIMVSALDSSGKATLKALWKEYEKQKYVGRG